MAGRSDSKHNKNFQIVFDFKKINIQADRPYWVAFNVFQGIGPIKFLAILRAFGSAEAAWRGSRRQWEKLNLSRHLIKEFIEYRQGFDPLLYLKRLTAEENKPSSLGAERRYSPLRPGPIWPLTWVDKEYPPILREVDSSPFVLYIKTGLRKEEWQALFSSPSLAVVGTRKITAYGRQTTSQLVRELVQAGLTIVSGMARGADSVAHQATIEAGGKTVAVLGCGVDVIYPPENRKLYQLILKNGAVISEFPPGMAPLPGNFPSRNRIIAGMSLGVLVTEGARKSGSLITASLAAQYGREVFAVPGPINSKLSAGPMFLIKNGAKLVSEVEDILEELGMGGLAAKRHSAKKAIREDSLSTEERLIIDSLENENLTVDEIIRKTGIMIDKLNPLLTALEIKGIIGNLGGGRWGRR